MRKNKNLYKIILDILMTIITILLMKVIFTGLYLHELLGLAVFILFLIHKLINYRVIKNMFSKLSQKSLLQKFIIITDILLLIDITLIAGTGIIISQYLFSNLINVSDTSTFSAIHHSSAYSGLILISIHLGLHWTFIINMFRKIFKISGRNNIRTILSRISAVVIILLGIKASFNQNVLSNLSEPFNSDNNTLSQSSLEKYNDNLLTEDNAASGNQNDTITSADNTSNAAPSLEEYLSSLFCTLCPKRCPLSSPLCSKGEELAQEATADYYALYKSTSNSSAAENNISERDTAENTYHGNSKRHSYKTSAENHSITDNSGAAENSDNDEKTNASKNTPIENAVNYVSIMGLYAGATYYIVKIPRKMK